MAALIFTAACHAVLAYYTGALATLAKCSEFHTNSHPANTRMEQKYRPLQIFDVLQFCE